MIKFKIQIIKETENSEEILNEIIMPLNTGITFNIENQKVNIDIKT